MALIILIFIFAPLEFWMSYTYIELLPIKKEKEKKKAPAYT